MLEGWRNALRYGHTVRYLKFQQIVGRAVARLKRRVSPIHIPAPPENLKASLKPRVSFPYHEPWNTSAVAEGQFCFLNQARALGRPVDWVAAEMPLLWRYYLHYFNYLRLLDPVEQVLLCKEWVRRNPIQEDISWHPFPMSLRIVNWCKAALTDPELLQSLYQQAAYLLRNMETYLLGNHLLENAKALVFAGLFFDGQGEAPKWLEKGLEIFRQETPEQVLNDGGFFERSPMYHALILEGYLDVLNILPQDHPDRFLFVGAAQRMSDFLVSVTHPNGDLALFNDATREIALPTHSVKTYVYELLGYEAQRQYSFPETGYFIHEGKDTFLVIDGGPIGPDYLPAHAHADIFSYELSIGGIPVVVDSGVFEYTSGKMRDYVRSTKAHNTVSVDGQSQAECWSSFRVARRYAPYDVAFACGDEGSQFRGSFDGYAHLIGDQIVHHRSIEVDAERRVVSVLDRIDGNGRHTVESCIHFHPTLDVLPNEGRVRLQGDNTSCEVMIEGGPWHLEEGWYCPEFGLRERNPVLVIGEETELPARLAYTIRY